MKAAAYVPGSHEPWFNLSIIGHHGSGGPLEVLDRSKVDTVLADVGLPLGFVPSPRRPVFRRTERAGGIPVTVWAM